MVLLVLGIHYQSAPIEIREQFAFVGNAASEISRRLIQDGWVSEALILCTCHRTELYAYTEDSIATANQTAILERLTSESSLKPESLMPYLYVYTGLAAVKHLMRVASGLESMVFGEAEIFGQLKRAYASAFRSETIGKILNRLFQTTFSSAKTIRTKTSIGAHPISVGFMAARLIEQRVVAKAIQPLHLDEARVLLIGAGEIIRLTALHLQKLGVSHWKIANRTTEFAEVLANRLQAEIIPWSSLEQGFSDVDIVITATSSALPLVKKAWIEEALQHKKLMLLLDLAVPRDIEPVVGTLEGVSLYTVDDLRDIIEDNLNIRKEGAVLAERIIQTQAEAFMDNLRAESAMSLIRELRDTVEELCHSALREALRKLKAGMPAEEVLERLACGLTNQWLHHPTRRLRQAAIEEDEAALLFTRELFGLREHETIDY